MAFGITLLFAGLVTNFAVSARRRGPALRRRRRLVPRGPAARARGDGPGRAAPRVPGVAARERRAHRARARTAPRATAARDPPDLGGRQGRPRGLGRDGDPRRALRRRRSRGASGIRSTSSPPAPRLEIAALPLEGLRQFHADALLLATRHPPPDVGAWSDSSTASCCRCSRGARSSSAASSRRCSGPGLLHASLDVVNPTLEARVDWPWFVVTQIGFGVVAGIVVTRTARRPHDAVRVLRGSRGDRDAGPDGSRDEPDDAP